VVSAVQDAQRSGCAHLNPVVETESICQTQAQPEGQGRVQAGTPREQRRLLGVGQQQGRRKWFGPELLPAV